MRITLRFLRGPKVLSEVESAKFFSGEVDLDKVFALERQLNELPGIRCHILTHGDSEEDDDEEDEDTVLHTKKGKTIPLWQRKGYYVYCPNPPELKGTPKYLAFTGQGFDLISKGADMFDETLCFFPTKKEARGLIKNIKTKKKLYLQGRQGWGLYKPQIRKVADLCPPEENDE